MNSLGHTHFTFGRPKICTTSRSSHIRVLLCIRPEGSEGLFQNHRHLHCSLKTRLLQFIRWIDYDRSRTLLLALLPIGP